MSSLQTKHVCSAHHPSMVWSWGLAVRHCKSPCFCSRSIGFTAAQCRSVGLPSGHMIPPGFIRAAVEFSRVKPKSFSKPACLSPITRFGLNELSRPARNTASSFRLSRLHGMSVEAMSAPGRSVQAIDSPAFPIRPLFDRLGQPVAKDGWVHYLTACLLFRFANEIYASVSGGSNRFMAARAHSGKVVIVTRD